MLTISDRPMWCLEITGCYIQLLADGSQTEPKLQFKCIHLAYVSAQTQHQSLHKPVHPSLSELLSVPLFGS
jgi:hypothetical protein